MNNINSRPTRHEIALGIIARHSADEQGNYPDVAREIEMEIAGQQDEDSSYSYLYEERQSVDGVYIQERIQYLNEMPESSFIIYL
tara:strand:- start:301 stop:555 length:255 start_codon:yes stop_codon:yes gene_type:complete